MKQLTLWPLRSDILTAFNYHRYCEACSVSGVEHQVVRHDGPRTDGYETFVWVCSECGATSSATIVKY